MAAALGVVLANNQEKEETEQRRALAESQSVVEKAKTDADFARETLYDTLRKNNEAIEELMKVSRESMSARHYEVLAAMLRHNADISEKLLKIHADHQKVQNNAITLVNNARQSNTNPGLGNTTLQVQNAVFVGTTADLLTMVRDVRPVVIEDQDDADDDVDTDRPVV